jgi:archaellum component FlaC
MDVLSHLNELERKLHELWMVQQNVSHDIRSVSLQLQQVIHDMETEDGSR